VQLPLTRARATAIVREVAKDSGRWSINVKYEPTHEWRRLVNRRQVEACLEEGYVLDETVHLDEFGNWRFRIGRVCAGLDVTIEVAVENGPPLPRLYVVAIKGDQI
jgi:hypothetical protein